MHGTAAVANRRAGCQPAPHDASDSSLIQLVRQHYLTALLSASAEEPPVRAHVSHTIMWQGADAYRGELEAFIAGQQRFFAELARRLGKQDLLSGEESKTLRPALLIHVYDQRPSQQPTLPAVATLPDNVTLEPF